MSFIGLLADTMAMVDSSDDDEKAPSRQGQGPRERQHRVPSAQTKWWKMITSESMNDEDSRNSRLFRRRYRVRFSRFKSLVEDTKSWLKPDGSPVFARLSAAGINDAKTVFVEIKVMIVLRWLATGASFDLIGELSETGETTARVTCITWVTEFVHRRWTDFVYPPEGEELKKVMKVFDRLGITGAAFSMDAVHVHWARCPVTRSNFCTGKEGYPTLAFNVAVTHSKRIIAATSAQYGARNDKTLVKYDAFIDDVRSGKSLKTQPFRLRKKDGTCSEETKAYGICDGGYHRWACLQAVEKLASDHDGAGFCKRIESVRKDVENVFGIMKMRHRVLFGKFLLLDQKVVSDVFHSCCIIHNMCQIDEGWDARGEDERFWSREAPDSVASPFYELDDEIIAPETVDDHTFVGAPEVPGAPEVTLIQEVELEYHELRKKIVENFAVKRDERSLQWMR